MVCYINKTIKQNDQNKAKKSPEIGIEDNNNVNVIIVSFVFS